MIRKKIIKTFDPGGQEDITTIFGVNGIAIGALIGNQPVGVDEAQFEAAR